MSRILVIDDHPSVREGIRTLLSSQLEGAQITTVGSCEEGVALAGEHRWSLIITDLSLPGRSGSELVGDLAVGSPQSRILVYTVHPERQYGVRALRAGAHGYITKDRPVDEFIAAVRALLSGKGYVSPELADELIERLNRPGEPQELLSDRELQVLRLLGQGLTPAQIATQIHINGKTVSTYRARIMEKLRLQSTADLIRFAIENELV